MERKFAVGDKVRVGKPYPEGDAAYGKVGTIIKVFEDEKPSRPHPWPYRLDIPGDGTGCFREDELKRVRKAK